MERSTFELSSIGRRSAVEMFAILGAAGGFVVGGCSMLKLLTPRFLSVVRGEQAWPLSWTDVLIASLSLLVSSLLYSLFGALLGAWQGLVYNLVSARVGGLVLDLEAIGPPPAQET